MKLHENQILVEEFKNQSNKGKIGKININEPEKTVDSINNHEQKKEDILKN